MYDPMEMVLSQYNALPKEDTMLIATEPHDYMLEELELGERVTRSIEDEELLGPTTALWDLYEHPCCKCGGCGGDYLDDGYMPCYHCCEHLTCWCRKEVSK